MSSFLFNKLSKIFSPLTGRKLEYQLYPISWGEFEANLGFLKAEQQLELRIIYRTYPDVINNFREERDILIQ